MEDLVALQAKLLARASDWLAPSGRLVYCTCSLFPEEGERQIETILARNPDLRLSNLDADWMDPKWKTQNGCLRILPDHWIEVGGIDGFFVAMLEKPS